MTKPLRIALVGADVMGRPHAAQITQNSETELVAIADPFSSALADELHLPSFTDHQQAIITATETMRPASRTLTSFEEI